MTRLLRTPVTARDARSLHAGETVFLSGTIVTGRDAVHAMLLDDTIAKPGVLLGALASGVIYHCGPVVKRETAGTWTVMAAGPTTSARMNRLQAAVLKAYDIHAVIGKGGMNGVDWAEASAVYLAFTGGAALIASKAITSVIDVAWFDTLGMAEAAWILDVDAFGPLVVTADTRGRDLHAEVIKEARANR